MGPYNVIFLTYHLTKLNTQEPVGVYGSSIYKDRTHLASEYNLIFKPAKHSTSYRTEIFSSKNSLDFLNYYAEFYQIIL